MTRRPVTLFFYSVIHGYMAILALILQERRIRKTDPWNPTRK